MTDDRFVRLLLFDDEEEPGGGLYRETPLPVRRPQVDACDLALIPDGGFRFRCTRTDPEHLAAAHDATGPGEASSGT